MKSIMNRLFVFCMLLMYFINTTQAQSLDELPVDRFGASYSPYTVGKNKLMMEAGTGFNFEKSDDFKTRSWDLPILRLRYGILEKVELQLSSFYTFEKDQLIYFTPLKERGLSQLNAAVKYNFLKNRNIWPDAAVLFFYDYNRWNYVGVDTINQSQIRFAFKNKLAEKVALKYNLAINWEWEKVHYSGSANYYFISISPLYKISENFSALMDGYAFLYNNKAFNQFFLGSALSYQINNKSAVDLKFAFRLNDYFGYSLITSGLGYSIKF